VSLCAWTSRAIAGAGVPDADAMMIIARRTRIDSCLARRTICWSYGRNLWMSPSHENAAYLPP